MSIQDFRFYFELKADTKLDFIYFQQLTRRSDEMQQDMLFKSVDFEQRLEFNINDETDGFKKYIQPSVDIEINSIFDGKEEYYKENGFWNPCEIDKNLIQLNNRELNYYQEELKLETLYMKLDSINIGSNFEFKAEREPVYNESGFI